MHLVLIRYTRPIDEVDAVRPAHREFLQTQYREGLLVCSGPRVDHAGGVLLARSGDRAAVEAMCAADPYALGGVSWWTRWRLIFCVVVLAYSVARTSTRRFCL